MKGALSLLGVMTVRKEELRIREFERYRGFYCGLCRTLGKRCGGLCRLALSFEMTFLAMLLTSLYEAESGSSEHRCALHPFEKRMMLAGEAIDYCADISTIISYYDLRDGWEDDRNVPAFVSAAFLAAPAKKAGETLPQQREATAQYVKHLHEIERRGETNLDAAANLTGELFARLCVMKRDIYEADLSEMGFYLGKFIYLCDSYEDLEKDEKRGSYNPLLVRKDDPAFQDNCEQMLGDMMARATMAFERLPLIEDVEIMRNILYSGIWLRFESASERRKAKVEP